MTKRNIFELSLAGVAMMLLAMPATAADQLPDPDGKAADMSKLSSRGVVIRLRSSFGLPNDYLHIAAFPNVRNERHFGVSDLSIA